MRGFPSPEKQVTKLWFAIFIQADDLAIENGGAGTKVTGNFVVQPWKAFKSWMRPGLLSYRPGENSLVPLQLLPNSVLLPRKPQPKFSSKKRK